MRKTRIHKLPGERRWNFLDNKPPGPWCREPDKSQWTDKATGLPCLIVRNVMFSLCGYVGVPPGHSLHGAYYNVVPVGVHGGLTFSDGCQEDPKHRGICHIPERGQSDKIWWFGFDCAHWRDLVPGMQQTMKKLAKEHPDDFPRRSAALPLPFCNSYKDFAYVRRECAQLALQLAEL